MQPTLELQVAAEANEEEAPAAEEKKQKPAGAKSPSQSQKKNEGDTSQANVDASLASPEPKAAVAEQTRTVSNASMTKQFQKGSMRVSNNNTGLQLSTQQTYSEMDQKTDNVWGVQISQRSPYSLEKMSRRILELKNEN